MAAQRINREEVFRIANYLTKSRKKVTAISIREISKTGSKGTIQKYLEEWRAENGIYKTPVLGLDKCVEQLKIMNQNFDRFIELFEKALTNQPITNPPTP